MYHINIKKLGIFKFPLLIFLGSLALAFLSLFLHDLIAIFFGKEEKFFYLIFIAIFFFFPFITFILIAGAIAEYIRRKYVKIQEKREAEENKELGI